MYDTYHFTIVVFLQPSSAAVIKPWRRQTAGMNLGWEGSRKGQWSKGREAKWGPSHLHLLRKGGGHRQEEHGGHGQVESEVNKNLLHILTLLIIFTF